MFIRKKFRNFLLMLVAFVGIVTLGCYVGIGKAANRNYSDVMRRASKENRNFGNSKVIDIGLLASHDALSDKISKNSQYNSKTSLPDLFGLEKLPIVKSVASNYAKAQSQSLDKQLAAGVRYIDARITKMDGTYYTMHSLLSGKLEDYLKELIEFLINNPGEFVVFDVATLSGDGNPNDLAQFMSTVKVNKNGVDYNIYNFIHYDTSKNFADVTYNDVTENGKSAGLVIIASSLNKSANAKNVVTDPKFSEFFKYKEKHTHWHNDPSSKRLISKIDGVVKSFERGNYSGFMCNQVQTTPIAKSIVADFGTGSLIKDAKKHNPAVVDHPHFDYWLSVMPCIWFDDVTSTYDDFNDKINEKILRYNVNLNNTVPTSKNYKQITSADQLKNNMRVLVKEAFTGNGFVGNGLGKFTIGEYKANTFAFNNDAQGLWILKKLSKGWKIMLPDGSYLKRVSGKLSTTRKESSSTTFDIKFSNKDTVTFVENSSPKYYISIDGNKLNLSKKSNDSFELYTNN